MFGNEDLDIRITRNTQGVKLQVSKEKDDEDAKE